MNDCFPRNPLLPRISADWLQTIVLRSPKHLTLRCRRRSYQDTLEETDIRARDTLCLSYLAADPHTALNASVENWKIQPCRSSFMWVSRWHSIHSLRYQCIKLHVSCRRVQVSLLAVKLWKDVSTLALSMSLPIATYEFQAMQRLSQDRWQW